MDLTITKAEINELRKAIQAAVPYTDEELCVLDGYDSAARRKATFAKNILVYFNLSLTDPNDYGNITE